MTEEEFAIIQQNQARAASLDAPRPTVVEQVTPDTRPESLIQAECVKLLEEDGWRPLRTDPVSDRGRGKGFGEVGMADYMFIRYLKTARLVFGMLTVFLKEPAAEILWVEFKSRRGEPAKHQLDWHNKERARGALTWIASVDFPPTVEGFREQYAKSGLMRRPRWW